MKIPLIIHQTWKSDNLPKVFSELSATWRKYHCNWTYKLWTDKSNRAFIKKEFPFFLKTYDNFEFGIQKADAVRYFILYKYGGIYADMDFECLRNLEPLLKEHKACFIRQPEAHCNLFDMKQIICNAFMASMPRHLFFKEIIKDMIENRVVVRDPNHRVLETTGPLMVTRVYDKFFNKNAIAILNTEALYPLSSFEVRTLLSQEKKISVEVQKKLDSAYGVHYWLNTWTDWDAEAKRQKVKYGNKRTTEDK